jgi:hypothetical protein
MASAFIGSKSHHAMLGSENHYTYVEVRDALGIIDTEGGAVIRFETLEELELAAHNGRLYTVSDIGRYTPLNPEIYLLSGS